MVNGCTIPPPSGLSEAIEFDVPVEGTIYVNFSWSSARCAEGYLFAMGTDLNFLNNPGVGAISTTLTSYRADFSNAPSATYYWAVASRCNRFTNEAGDWSEVKTFAFNP